MPPADSDFNAPGGYVIDREVGHGGHARVYRAHPASDPHLVVALKVLDADHRTPAERARLDREFEFARSLDHPHLVTVHEHGPFWLTMQLIDGGKLTGLRVLDDQLTALAQIADALDYTHRRGIVHCDVKPTNILVGVDFSSVGAVLIDFGVAHAVVEDVGRRQPHPQVSLPYTAPEVLLGHPPAAATDEYALACTAVELLTGAPPFAADSAAELAGAQLRSAPPRFSREFGWASRAFDTVLSTAMAKDPDQRYRSCTELVDHITRALGSPR